MSTCFLLLTNNSTNYRHRYFNSTMGRRDLTNTYFEAFTFLMPYEGNMLNNESIGDDTYVSSFPLKEKSTDLSLSNFMNVSAGRPGSPSGEANAKKFSQSAYLPSKSADERFREFQLGHRNDNLSRSFQSSHGVHNLESQNMEQMLQNLKQGQHTSENTLRKQILEKEHQKYNTKYQTNKYAADGKRLSKAEDNFEKLKQSYDVEALSKEHLEQSYRNLEQLRRRDINRRLEEDPEYERSQNTDAGYRLGEEEDTDKYQLRRKSTGYRLRDDDEEDAHKKEDSIHEDLSFRQRNKERAAAKRREHMLDLQTSSRQRSGKRGTLIANLSGTRYDAVIQIAEHQGFSVTKKDTSSVNLIWNDSFVSTEKIAELKPFQKINHFPGMGEITRKDCLARNIKKVQETHKKEFSFIPDTWLPNEHSLLVSHAKELKAKKKQKTFIVKPSNRAQGHGIELFTNPEKIPNSDNHIVQEYIDRPFLLDRFKFDLRLYVLITSCEPLRVYLFKDGLVRMSTEKYLPPDEQNLDHKFMHLTNYSVNKHNEDYQRGNSANSGSKRSVQYFLNYVAEKTDKNVGQLWLKISDIIVKTLLIGLPQMYTSYKLCRPGSDIGSDSVCFEILGFDFLLDWNLTPWLIEVNRSPSFGIDENIDAQIKPTLIDDTLKLLNMRPSDRERCMRAQKDQTEKRLHSSTRRMDEASKRKDDLNDLLQQIRNLTLKEEIEKKNCGHFQRIFPVEDKSRQDLYVKLMFSVTNILMPDRASTLQREMKRMYTHRAKEDDLLEMIAQCEIDAKSGKLSTRKKIEDDEDGTEETTSRKHGTQKSKTKSSLSLQSLNGVDKESSNFVSPMDEDNMAKKTLLALNKAKVRFPGKSLKESELFLDQMHDKWKIHKQKIGTYWLVKLDSTKREKLIDIVRSTVQEVLKPIWPNEIENVPLYRNFNKIFARMLSNHGQGLWNCFSTNIRSASSWEAIVSKSSRVVTEVELNCCRRVVQLCQDCLVIVYQFTAETEAQTI